MLGSVGNVKTKMARWPCKLGFRGGVPHAARLNPETFEKTHRHGPGKPPLVRPCAVPALVDPRGNEHWDGGGLGGADETE